MWIRIDDAMADHPKYVSFGKFAPLMLALQVRALCWSARHLTDGLIPVEAVSQLLTGFSDWATEVAGVEHMVGVGRTADEFPWPDIMVEAGLWEARRERVANEWRVSGYVIHDYLEYNPSKTQALLERARKRQNQQDLRSRHRAVTATSPGDSVVTDGTVTGVSPPPRTRTRTPKSKTTSKSKALVALARDGGVGFPAQEQKTAKREQVASGLRLAATVVFNYWRAKMGKTGRTVLDDKRRARIIRRLRENGGDVGELLYAVDGALRDPHLMGENDNGRRYDGIETILRDRGQVERLASAVPGRQSLHPALAEHKPDGDAASGSPGA